MLVGSRAERSLLGEWWRSVDLLSIGVLVLLMLIGFVALIAASPAVAVRIGLEEFFFVKRQAIMLPLAFVTLLFTSTLSTRNIRRLALFMFVSGTGFMIFALVDSEAVKGAKRWVELGGNVFQPSEFVKPAFIMLSAWLLSEHDKHPDMHSIWIMSGIYLLFVTLLVLQPDFGQTFLISTVWIILLFIYGIPLVWIFLLLLLALVGAFAAYTFVPYVANRINAFILPDIGEKYQVNLSLQSFAEGGIFGKGPGAGTVKQLLPDAHSDFIFAVIGEEYGALACVVVICCFGFVVLRVISVSLRKLRDEPMYATIGLVSLFGLQALINMAVNVDLFPAKGMTLPFISYGGSSLLAMAVCMGAVLALMRRR
jgi:cell division protein FtsW